MRNIIVAVSNFGRYSTGKLMEFTSGIIAKLTGNPNFSTVAPLLANVIVCFDKFRAAVDAAWYGNPAQIQAKNNAKQDLVNVLKQLCAAVNVEQGGNREALLTSGFNISKEFRQPVILEPIKKLDINYTKISGRLQIVVKKGAGTRSVVYEYTTDAEVTEATTWNTFSSTESTYFIDNLPVAEYLHLRAAAVGTRRQMLLTEIFTKLIA